MHQPRSAQSVRLDIFISVALFLFVIVRGLGLATALMPFEGWDEYNYLAVADYLDRHDEMPTMTQSVEPSEDYIAFLQAHPHPRASAGHFANLRLETYHGEVLVNGEWVSQNHAPPPAPEPAMPPMFQAQQGRFYFQIFVWLKRAMGLKSFLAWADAGRILNIIFGAGAVVCWYVILRLWMPASWGKIVATGGSLMFATNSLFLYNTARVGNSALAVLLGSLAFLIFFLLTRAQSLEYKRALPAILFLGTVCGFAVQARITTITLLPAFSLGLLVWGWFTFDRSKWKILSLPLVLLLGYAMIMGPRHYHAIRTSGSITGDLTSAKSQDRGLIEKLKGIAHLDSDDTPYLLLYNWVHQGPWSFLSPPEGSRSIFRKLLRAGFAMFVAAAFWHHWRRRMLDGLKDGWVPLLHLLLTWAAILYFAVTTQMAWGRSASSTRYSLLAFPALCTLLLLGAGAIRAWLAALFALAYSALFSYAYYQVTYSTLLHYETGEHTLAAAWNKVTQHHALLTAPAHLWLTGEGVLLAILGSILIWQTIVLTRAGSNKGGTTGIPVRP